MPPKNLVEEAAEELALTQIELDAADVNLEEVVRLGAALRHVYTDFATSHLFAAAEVLADANRRHQ